MRRAAQLFLGIGVLVGVVACLALADGYVFAQQARNGVRVQLGQIASSGGLAGQAFVPIPPSAVTAQVLDGAPCAGRRLSATGRLPRGPVRTVEVTLLLTETGRTGTIGAGACPGATIAIELEGGERVELDRGDLSITELDLAAGTVASTFRGTGARAGDPITITGDLRLQYRDP